MSKYGYNQTAKVVPSTSDQFNVVMSVVLTKLNKPSRQKTIYRIQGYSCIDYINKFREVGSNLQEDE
mgnify:CR=1 FL=1